MTLAALGENVFGWACVVLGSRGMPRRYFVDCPPPFTSMQVVASLGAFFMTAGLITTACAYVAGIRAARVASH